MKGEERERGRRVCGREERERGEVRKREGGENVGGSKERQHHQSATSILFLLNKIRKHLTVCVIGPSLLVQFGKIVNSFWSSPLLYSKISKHDGTPYTFPFRDPSSNTSGLTLDQLTPFHNLEEITGMTRSTASSVINIIYLLVTYIYIIYI